MDIQSLFPGRKQRLDNDHRSAANDLHMEAGKTVSVNEGGLLHQLNSRS